MASLEPPAAAPAGAGATASVSSLDARTRRGRVFAWALWDWGSAAFNAVATTFVFTVYVTGSSFGDKTANSAALSWALAIAGIVVLLIAPVTGQRSDASAHRKR